MTAALLDVRPARAFEAGHRAGAANIPLEELDERIHELPPSGTALTVVDADAARATRAAEWLRARGRWSVSTGAGMEGAPGEPIERGPSHVRLWRPHALLEEALPIIAEAWGGLDGRRAADLACGSGRDAVFLALAGLQVDAFDVLPDALAKAAALAARNGVSLRTRRVDLENAAALHGDSFDLVVVFHFLHRPLLRVLRRAVRPGGFLIYETFLTAQREQYGKPARDAHLLRPGELRGAFAGWRSIIDREGEASAGRITAQWSGRRPIDEGA